MSAIPIEWKNILKEDHHEEYQVNNPFVNMQGNSQIRNMYRKLSFNDEILDHVVQKWSSSQNEKIQMDYDELLKSIIDMYKTTNYPKLRSFHYRLVTKSLTTNIHLKYYKIKENNTCSFCEKEKETLRHLFYECDKISSFWREIYEWLNVDPLNFKDMILNNTQNNPKYVQNTIIMLAKMHIYKQRCLGEPIIFLHFQKYVQKIERIENYIAKQNDKETFHQQKWEEIKW